MLDVIEARIVRDTLVAPAVTDPQHAAPMVVSSAALATLRTGGRYAVAGSSDALTLNGSDTFAPFPTES